MGSSRGGTVCCGIRKEIIQDCLEFRWLVYDSTPQAIYQATEIVSASGTLQITSATTGMTDVTIDFLIGSTPIKRFNLGSKQSKAFTIVGFDTIILTGNSSSLSESAAGTLCLTPRYELF